MRASRAFTLIELLVAIGVIAILAALVLSAFSRTRATTQAISCRNNLRQWGQATHAFAADHQDLLPPEGTGSPTEAELHKPSFQGWYIQLPEQMNLPPYRDMTWRTNAKSDVGNTIWICPANQRRSNGINLFHYCLNEHVDGTGTNYNNYSMPMANVRQPSQVVWMFDNGGLAAVAQQNNVHSNLHSRGAQFLFVDGHVTRFRNKEYWNFAGNKGITNNPELVWIP
jgi:prepilin-type N-terminal cleavage/methylation domain-containing protein/prepilin-type processing-associated H-X9-DG protein